KAESKVESKVENPLKDDPADDFFITFYYDERYGAYSNLCDTPDKTFKTGCKGLGKDTNVRFTTPTSGVKVEFLNVEWCAGEKYFHTLKTIFTTTTKKDKIYQFDASLTNGTPDYIIKATKGNKIAYWHLMNDGEPETTIHGALPDQGLEEDSIMTPLIKSYITFSCLTGGNDIAKNKDVFWQAISFAYQMQHEAEWHNGQTYYNPETWIVDAYAKTMFPKITKYPSFPKDNFIGYDNSAKTRYKFTPCVYASDENFTYVRTEYKSDGTADVDYMFVMEDFKIPLSVKRVHLEPVQDVNGDNPFLWRITGIETLPFDVD
ncbi:MAG: hypothetical protein ACI4II_01185, partial [Acutalibacteraceae bacterium]